MPLRFNATPEKWEIDGNGFMRCRCRFLSVGLMEYSAQELEMTDGFGDKVLSILVDTDAISDPHAIRSLEGMPVLAYEHEWLSPNSEHVTVGSIAGTPVVNGPYLEGEIVITNPLAIEAIKNKSLSDISSAYNASYIMESGDYDGDFFDGKQTKLRYNHVALLKPGEGRGGQEVRVLNKKENMHMSQEKYTSVQMKNGLSVRVINEDVQVMNKAVENMSEEATKNEKTATANMDETLDKLSTLNAEAKTRNGEIEELKGKLSEMSERLNEALSPEKVEETAMNMAKETEEAKELLTKNGADEKTLNSIKGLYGHELRLKSVNAIKTQNSRTIIDGDNAKNENFVSGVYSTMIDVPVMNKKKVAGSKSVDVKTQNSNNDGRVTGTKALGY